MGIKLRRKAILEASAASDPAEALRILQPSVLKNRTGSDLGQIEEPDLRFVQLLAGVLLRAGRVGDAAFLLTKDIPISPVPPVDAIVLDPEYNGVGGHQDHHDRFYASAIADAGHPFACVVTAGYPEATAALPNAFAVLPQVPPPLLLPGQSEADVIRLLNALFRQLFEDVLPRRRPRLLVVPTVRPHFINAVAEYLIAADGEASTALLLDVHDDYWARGESEGPAGIQTAETLTALANSGLFRLMLIAETEPIAAGLRRRFGDRFPIETVPAIGAFAAELSGIRRDLDKLPTFGFVGRCIPERGAHLLPEIVDRTLAARDGLNWLMQWKPRGETKRLATETVHLLDRAVDCGRVEIVPSRVPNPEYFSILERIDVMVMPFEGIYNQRGSGIAAECLRTGCIMVAPEESSMAQAARSHGAPVLTFRERTPEMIAEACLSAFDRYSDLAKASWEAATRMRDHDGVRAIRQFIEAA